ncbi:MAG: cell envelope integrity protein CreD [Aquabacterium sp.]|uniref:cell envelope integrity protein CreD n=1 Tax=Aquabacterium sp. TaxID=1872578 RepID=UPI0027261976|nr:cell envelope integrity protein CreD [Aquabacterium sp.]MDO9004803.1 cell envelope integrity protein CreD [Aquabacterium sp.]
MKFPMLSKATALAAVILGLLWALWSVQALVRERQERQGEAERSVANSLATSQTLMGPTLARRCTETWVSGQTEGKDPRPVLSTASRELRLAPTLLKVDATVDMTLRHRGMFKVNGYGVRSGLAAEWADVRGLIAQAEHPGGEVKCDAPFLSVALSDARGIRVAEMRLQGQSLPILPGSGMAKYPQGFQAPVLADLLERPGPWQVDLNLEIAGTQSLSLAPVANTTQVTLKADWPHPSFGGRFLPTDRQVGERDFTASWKVTSLASTAQSAFTRDAPLCPAWFTGDPVEYATRTSEGGSEQTGCIEAFGVAFVDPVSPYVLSDRATKYGLLFIVLTFVGVGLVEVLRSLRVHPIQYLLVGAALTVFFLLLVSLSERLAFGIAYALAAGACTLLLTFYGSFVLQGWRSGLAFGAGIAGLFGTLYALLQLEQNALVLGSGLLFLVLTAIMVSTRRLDWYALMDQMRTQAGTPIADKA